MYRDDEFPENPDPKASVLQDSRTVEFKDSELPALEGAKNFQGNYCSINESQELHSRTRTRTKTRISSKQWSTQQTPGELMKGNPRLDGRRMRGIGDLLTARPRDVCLTGRQIRECSDPRQTRQSGSPVRPCGYCQEDQLRTNFTSVN